MNSSGHISKRAGGYGYKHTMGAFENGIKSNATRSNQFRFEQNIRINARIFAGSDTTSEKPTGMTL
jgi:hypothetical protein